LSRFVKNLGKDTTLCPNGMDVAKLTQKKVLQTLENGVRFGKWVLLENIGEVSEREREQGNRCWENGVQDYEKQIALRESTGRNKEKG